MFCMNTGNTRLVLKKKTAAAKLEAKNRRMWVIYWSCLSLLLLTQMPCPREGREKGTVAGNLSWNSLAANWEFPAAKRQVCSQLRDYLIIAAQNWRDLVCASLHSPQLCVSHPGCHMGGELPSRFHFSSTPTFTHLLLQRPQLGPPHPIILYLTPREISEITTSWSGRSCLLPLPHPTRRHSAITYLFGMCLPHAALAHFPQTSQTVTLCLSVSLSQEMHSHIT